MEKTYEQGLVEGKKIGWLRRGQQEKSGEMTTQVSRDGKHWEPAKQEPYQLYGIESIQCAFGFHELVQSKKYAHTKYCFRCGKRKQDKKFEY